jgi:predicted Zn-dependent protease with MMP-like domain
MSDEAFAKLIADAMDSLPEDRIKGLDNVAITYDDEPSPDQRKKLHLRGSQTLFGLYEGIPLTKRAAASSLFSSNPMILPDKITIFKKPILHYTGGEPTAVAEQVRKTLWHEIAHFYGLDHDQIRRLE